MPPPIRRGGGGSGSDPSSPVQPSASVSSSSSSYTTTQRLIVLVIAFLCGFLVCNISSVLHVEHFFNAHLAALNAPLASHNGPPSASDCLLTGTCKQGFGGDSNKKGPKALQPTGGAATGGQPRAGADVAVKGGQPTLDLFVVLRDYSPRAVLGDLEPTADDPRARTHLLSANDDAWWPESLRAKIAPLSSLKSFSTEAYKAFGNGAAMAAVLRDRLAVPRAQSHRMPEPGHCTPNQLVGLLSENVRLNASTVLHLSKRLPLTAHSVVDDGARKRGCPVYYSGADVVNIAESMDDAVLAVLVREYNTFFGTEHRPEKLAAFAKRAQLYVPPSNMVMPRSHFEALAAWIDGMIAAAAAVAAGGGTAAGGIAGNAAITDPTRMATAVFLTILAAGNAADSSAAMLHFEAFPLEVLSRPHPHVLLKRRVNAIAETLDEGQRRVLVAIATTFRLYDEAPWSDEVVPVFASMCIGVDCMVMEEQFETLRGLGTGYIIIVMNARDPAMHQRYAVYKRAFPGRFLLLDPGRKLSCAESWNRIVTTSFEHLTIPVSHVIIANADFLVTNGHMRGWNAWMRANDAQRLNDYPIVEYHHFYMYAYTRLAWITLGLFDENVYPAYGEDVDFVYRSASYARAMGYNTDDKSPNNYFFPFPEYPHWEKHYVHKSGGSSSLRDPEIANQLNRWDRQTPFYAKWNLKVFEHGGRWEKWDHRRHPPFKHPYGMSHIPHRNCWVLDPGHRRCIMTGQGHRYRHNRNMCWMNFTMIYDRWPLPEGMTPSSHLAQWSL